jgi:hypothetical protein
VRYRICDEALNVLPLSSADERSDCCLRVESITEPDLPRLIDREAGKITDDRRINEESLRRHTHLAVISKLRLNGSPRHRLNIDIGAHDNRRVPP